MLILLYKVTVDVALCTKTNNRFAFAQLFRIRYDCDTVKNYSKTAADSRQGAFVWDGMAAKEVPMTQLLKLAQKFNCFYLSGKNVILCWLFEVISMFLIAYVCNVVRVD